MLTIILQYTTGFLDSFVDHTERALTEKEVKYNRAQLHEPLIVQHEPHRHPNPIGKLKVWVEFTYVCVCVG